MEVGQQKGRGSAHDSVSSESSSQTIQALCSELEAFTATDEVGEDRPVRKREWCVQYVMDVRPSSSEPYDEEPCTPPENVPKRRNSATNAASGPTDSRSAVPMHPRQFMRIVDAIFSASEWTFKGAKVELEWRVKRHEAFFNTCLRLLKAGDECTINDSPHRLWLGEKGNEILWSDEYGAVSTFDLTIPYTVYFCPPTLPELPSFTLIRHNGSLAGPFTMSEELLASWTMTLASIRVSYSNDNDTKGIDLELWQAARVVIFELAQFMPFTKAYHSIDELMQQLSSSFDKEWSLPLIEYSREFPDAEE